MSSFDYNAPAELFLPKPAKGSRTKYRRFETAAEALRYAVEDLRTPKAFGGAAFIRGRRAPHARSSSRARSRRSACQEQFCGGVLVE